MVWWWIQHQDVKYPRGKDKRLVSFKNFDWKLIRVNDFSSFIHHISTVNNAQIIKRNVSVSVHSISAIRWHYCTLRAHWLIPFVEFNIRRSGVGFFFVFTLRSASKFFAVVVFLFIVMMARTYRNIEQQIEHKQQSACRAIRNRDNLTSRREGGNNILWITIICLWSNASMTAALPWLV